MPDRLNIPLRDFLSGFAPCDSEQLWKWIVINRLANPREDLPASYDALETALRYLEARGYVLAQGDDWVMCYPQPSERVVGQQAELFA